MALETGAPDSYKPHVDTGNQPGSLGDQPVLFTTKPPHHAHLTARLFTLYDL